MTEFALCPFCKKNDKLKVTGANKHHPVKAPRYRVHCTRCHILGPTAITEKEAADIWNAKLAPWEPGPLYGILMTAEEE